MAPSSMLAFFTPQIISLVHSLFAAFLPWVVTTPTSKDVNEI